MTTKSRLTEVNKRLKVEFPTVETPLTHSNEFELLVAVILSTQTLDTTTNKVTPALFKKYPTPKDLAKADPEEVNEYIKIINYHWTKANNLVKMANILIERFNGKVPKTIDELTQLPGVGRKVANVVINEWFGRHLAQHTPSSTANPPPAPSREGNFTPEGFVVDTHVKRVAYRLGFTKETNPEKVEKDLMKIVPKDEWVDFSLRLIFHGRKTCKSQRPLCEGCPLKDICPKVGVDPVIKVKAEAKIKA